jgi:hypothetical protein
MLRCARARTAYSSLQSSCPAADIVIRRKSRGGLRHGYYGDIAWSDFHGDVSRFLDNRIYTHDVSCRRTTLESITPSPMVLRRQSLGGDRALVYRCEGISTVRSSAVLYWREVYMLLHRLCKSCTSISGIPQCVTRLERSEHGSIDWLLLVHHVIQIEKRA